MRLVPVLVVWLLASLADPIEGIAYSIRLYQPSDFPGAPADSLARQAELAKEELIIENFEKEGLLDGIASNVAGGSNNSRGFGEFARNPSAWDGKMASTENNAPAFSIALPGIRSLGLGVGDNDGGRESISVNGGAPVLLSSLPNHSINSGGRAYYLVITAEPADPDIRAIAFSNGLTLALDHLILSKSASLGGGGVIKKVPTSSRVEQLNAMAERIAQTLEKRSPKTSLSTNHQVLNGDFESIAGDPREGDLTGSFGEAMFSPASARLTGWSVFGGPITLRTRPQSPAGGNLIELGPRNPPGGISQTVQTAVGQNYELSFYACSGRDFQCNRQIRVRAGAFDQVVDSPIGSTYRLIKLEFRATSPSTTLSVSAVGEDGFGPLIDEVRVAPAARK